MSEPNNDLRFWDFEFFWTGGADSPVVAVSNVIIAAVVLADLVFGFGESARQHTDLYRRFNAVQEKIARHREDSSARLAEWEAEVVEIRRDEPPVLWAVYATCWNQVIERRQADRSHLRKIEWYQRLLRNFLQFRPIDFPLGAN